MTVLRIRLIPRPLHRLALRAAHRVRSRFRRVFKLPLEGVSVLITDLEGRLLMVRHSYGSQAWLLPGGGMKRGERAEDAARREIAEELGCELENPVVLQTISETMSGAPHTAHLVAARTLDRPAARRARGDRSALLPRPLAARAADPADPFEDRGVEGAQALGFG